MTNVAMTNLESKRLELLKILPELQCHECKDVPGPNGYDKNRYSCMKGSHVLCEKHRVKKCPCGSKIAKKPSSIIAKLLQDLPWMCQNYKNGCREFKMDVEGLDIHHRKCIFRPVFCPDARCQGDKKVMFKDIAGHFTTFHKNVLALEMLVGGENKWIANKPMAQLNLDKIAHLFFLPNKVTRSDGTVFYEVGCLINNAFHFIIFLIGPPEAAKSFSCSVSVTTNDGEKYLYIGKVHTLDEKKEDIIVSESCFKIGNNVVKRSLDAMKKLNIEFSISRK